MIVQDTLEIYELIARFTNCFDLKDWDGLQTCLTETIDTDYSDLRGTPPETLRAEEYVRIRRESLENLQLHHLSGNIELKYTDLLNGVCRVSMVIWRRSDTDEFTSHCIYTFKVTKVEDDWCISSIAQKVLWNEGNSSIHKGAKK
jgi:hypothetical protein